MSYDYSKIIAMYKDDVELFRLYQGNDMLWEKPFKRFYVWVNDISDIRDIINGVSQMSGQFVGVDSVNSLLGVVDPSAFGGIFVEIRSEDDDLIGSIATNSIPLVQTFVNEKDSLIGSTDANSLQGVGMEITSGETLNGSAVVLIEPDNKFVYCIERFYIQDLISNFTIMSVNYVPGIVSLDLLNSSVSTIIGMCDFMHTIDVSMLSGESYVVSGDMVVLKTESFDDINGYVQFMTANSWITHVWSTDQGLNGNCKITMYRLSLLSDFDSLYLSNMDDKTLEELRLRED